MRTNEIKDVVEAAKKKGLIRAPGQTVPVTVAAPEAARFGNVSVSFEKVSPEVARYWLANNIGNRALRRTTLNSYVRDMRAGEWVTNHQGIAFAEDNTLLDGQHRLNAIVESGTPVLLMISRGWPKHPDGKRVRTMDTVDVGAGRSLSDLLQLQHGTENPRIVTATARIIAQISCDFKGNHVGRMSMSGLLLISSLFPDGIKFVAENAPKNKGLRQAEVLGVMAMAYAEWREKVAEFCRLLTTGAGMADNHPILPLRNYLLGDALKAKGLLVVATAVASHLKLWIEGGQADRLHRSEDSLRWMRNINPEATSKIAAMFKGSK